SPADLFDLRSADEYHLQRLLTKGSNALMDRALELSSICITTNSNVESAKAFLRRIGNIFRQQDRSGAGPKSWFGTDEVAQLLEEAALFQKVQESRRFAARDHKRID